MCRVLCPGAVRQLLSRPSCRRRLTSGTDAPNLSSSLLFSAFRSNCIAIGDWCPSSPRASCSSASSTLIPHLTFDTPPAPPPPPPSLPVCRTRLTAHESCTTRASSPLPLSVPQLPLPLPRGLSHPIPSHLSLRHRHSALAAGLRQTLDCLEWAVGRSQFGPHPLPSSLVSHSTLPLRLLLQYSITAEAMV